MVDIFRRIALWWKRGTIDARIEKASKELGQKEFVLSKLQEQIDEYEKDITDLNLEIWGLSNERRSLQRRYALGLKLNHD